MIHSGGTQTFESREKNRIVWNKKLTRAKVSTRKTRLPLELTSWEMERERNRVETKDPHREELIPEVDAADLERLRHAAYAAAIKSQIPLTTTSHSTAALFDY